MASIRKVWRVPKVWSEAVTKDGHYNSKKKEDKNGNKKEDKKNDKKEREQKWQTMIYKTLHRKLKID